MSAPRAFGAIAVAAWSLAACTALLVLPAAARAVFVAPSPVGQWNIGPSNAELSVGGIEVGRSGDVYALRNGPGSFRVLRYGADGTPSPGQWANARGFASGGLTTDPVGHVFVAGNLGQGQGRLLEYTADGGLLAAIPAKRLIGSSLDADRNGHIFATGRSASAQVSINEYSIAKATAKLIASGAYPGTPSENFLPESFLGIAVAPSGSVYASGTSTTNSFLARFTVGLGSPVSYLERCPATSDACFGGFGLEVAGTAFPPDPAEPMVYAPGAYGAGAGSEAFYATGIYRPFGNPSQYQGSFGPIPLPAPTLLVPFDAAASPCDGSVYTLNSRFGGPGGTYDGVVAQEFDTHAPASPCPPPSRAALSGLKRRYTLRAARHATSPCTPCAKLQPSGRYDNRPAAPARSAALAARRPRAGVLLRFRATAAADVTFTFKRVAGRGPRTSLGGFVYPAREGQNRVRFSGVLRKGRRLSPGAYRVTASAGAGRRHLRLRVLADR